MSSTLKLEESSARVGRACPGNVSLGDPLSRGVDKPLRWWHASRAFSLTVAVAVCLLAGGAGSAFAAQTLTNASFTNFKSAVATGGTIFLAFDGTISNTSTITLSFNTIIDASGHSVIISGNNTNRIFDIPAGVSLTLTNLTLANGNSTGSNGVTGTTGASGDTKGQDGGAGSAGIQALGGAVRNLGNVYFFNCSVLNNSAFGGNGGNGGAGGNGAAQAGLGGTGGNGGNALGGGIFNGGFALFTNCTLSGNVAFGGNGGTAGTNGTGNNPGLFAGGGAAGFASGAGIYNTGTVVLVNCALFQNSATGGVSAAAGTISTPTRGGTGYVGGGGSGAAIANTGTSRLVNCTLYNNVVGGGAGGVGGIGTAQGGDGGNGGLAAGGSIYNTGFVTITNCTFSAGAAFGGPGGAAGTGPVAGAAGATGVSAGANIYNAGGGTFNLVNTILANGTHANNSGGTVTDFGGNISSDSTPAFTQAASTNNTDPKLGAFDINGAAPLLQTMTLPLLQGSPAIDKAIDSAAPNFDQRGMIRPLQNSKDIGAFEFGIITFNVSGRVTLGSNGLSGVTIATETYSAQTDANGNYSLNLPPGGFTIVPASSGSFSPPSRSVTVSSAAVAGVNFAVTNAGSAAVSSVSGSSRQFQLSFTGLFPNLNYRIQASTNLVNWQDLFTNNSGASGMLATNFSATNFSRRFFRALAAP